MAYIHPTDKKNGVMGYTSKVGPCINCNKPANCLFDIGTPIPVRACTQECANNWWQTQIRKLEEV